MQNKKVKGSDEVFTQFSVVEFILNEVSFNSSNDLRDVTLLEPSAGEGSFVVEILRRLYLSSRKYNFSFISAINKNLRFVELDIENYETLKSVISVELECLGFSYKDISSEVVSNKDFLLVDLGLKFDCIVGNPPYIRHESIEEDSKKAYKHLFKLFKYRADLYIVFYEKSLSLLKENGSLSFICSNRWLYNQYGRPLRKLVAENYHISKIINMEKADVFDGKVNAYPCITTIVNTKGNITSYYESTDKTVDLNNISMELKKTPVCDSWQNLFLKYDINNVYLEGIIEQGFELGIGVATGADKIFIRKESELGDIEKSRIIPIIKSSDLKDTVVQWSNSYLLNPYEDGSLCQLEKYPNLCCYLESNKELLSKRYVAKKSPSSWYRTIDKVKPELMKKNKLLLPDLAGCKFFFIDEGSYYPHHNLYYITHANLDYLKVLGCILMSRFIRQQMMQIGIKMNGGLPRYQIQTIKKLRVPIIKSIDNCSKRLLIEAYDNQDFITMNRVIDAYCVEFGVDQLCSSSSLSVEHIT